MFLQAASLIDLLPEGASVTAVIVVVVLFLKALKSQRDDATTAMQGQQAMFKETLNRIVAMAEADRAIQVEHNKNVLEEVRALKRAS